MTKSISELNSNLATDISNVDKKASYVGMIIHTTILSTLTKVKEVFGNNTTWISHSGYFLRGATSGVTANSATSTGGNDGAWLMKHTHTYQIMSTGLIQSGVSGGYVQNNWAYPSTGQAGTVDSSNTTANIPKYKSVYIWERTA